MKDKIKIFKRLIDNAKTNIDLEYANLILRMSPYDSSAFLNELSHEYSSYSSKYFDEDKFTKLASNVYGVDLTIPEIKDELFESIKNYSQAHISFESLKQYLEDNRIELDEDDE